MDTVRAFVGCVLDPECTRRVAELARALRRAADGAGWRASWVPEANLHVTIRFLGETDRGLLPSLGEALADAARGCAPIDVAVGGLGAFPEGGRGAPRVLFARLGAGHERVADLARRVDDAFERLGVAREPRPFHAHITLARVKHAPRGGPSLAALAPAESDCGSARIADVTLFRSELAREGAAYHALARHALVG